MSLLFTGWTLSKPQPLVISSQVQPGEWGCILLWGVYDGVVYCSGELHLCRSTLQGLVIAPTFTALVETLAVVVCLEWINHQFLHLYLNPWLENIIRLKHVWMIHIYGPQDDGSCVLRGGE